LNYQFNDPGLIVVVIGYEKVILQDVEVLRHLSPTAIKRNSEGRPKDVLSRVTDIESRCAIGIEGHRSKKHCV